MGYFRDNIFKWFGAYEARIDTNKDANGRGMMERLNRVIGAYIDGVVMPDADGIAANLIDPVTARADMLPYLADMRGVADLRPTGGVAAWRRIVENSAALVAHIGTRRGLWVTLRLSLAAGEYIGVTITEYYNIYGFDSPVRFDDPRRKFDSAVAAEIGVEVTVTAGMEYDEGVRRAVRAAVAWCLPVDTAARYININGITI